MQPLFTKNRDWLYEREWQVIRVNGCDPIADHKTYGINAQLVDIPSIAMVPL